MKVHLNMAKSHKTCMEQAEIIDTFGTYQVGPEYLSITWIDKSRSCNNTPQHISTEYPRYNRYGQHISVRRWDVSQSIQEDSNYASTHGQRNGLLRSVITTLKPS